MEKEKCIRVVPDLIFFRDLSPGESDSVEIWIHNVGKKPVQMRLKLPPDSPFNLSTLSIPMTAPGLEQKVTITYKAKENKSVSSELLVLWDDCSVSVPITAIPPCPRITPDTTKISLGTVGVSTNFKFSFSLSNIGIIDGTFNLSCKEKGLTIIPDSGPIQPSKSVEITCNFKPPKTGDYNFAIKIDTPGAFEPCTPIEVSATAVQHSLALMLDDKEVSELDFETVYFGQKRVITTTIVNRGPFKQSFVVLPPRDTANNSPRNNAPAHYAPSGDQEVVFSASPSEGLLNPYGSVVVRFIFNPPMEKAQTDDIDTLFNQFTSIEVVETSQKIDFQLTGKAVHHLISLSSVDFNFDKTAVKQKSSLKLTITNLSHFLPTSFEIKPVAHFRFDPIKSTIKVNQSEDVNIIFYPKNLGLFELSTAITFCGGLARKKINLSGSCGDEDKPFKRVPAYESDSETRFNSLHPDARFAYELDDIKKNEQRRSMYDAFLTDSEKTREERSKKRDADSRMKRDAEAYLSRTVGQFTKDDVNDYIQNHIEDFQNDDISLANSGLSPPDPGISRKAAPLYLPHPEKFGLVSTPEDERRALNNRKKEILDDNVPIKKKFKAKATTPAEINECNRALTPAQQLMVVSSHQTLNFGQISVFSHITKSFTIQNNLQQNILVTLKYEYEELSESTPVSQVIPPNQVGGFDIKFTSSKSENFMKTIQYTVNGHHTYSFNVCAQVVPIDVQLSRSIIEFRFSSDSSAPAIKEFVSVINKSNSIAEYSWTGISPPFFINNLNGYVDANKTTNVEIVYRPNNRPHDEITLTCNVVGGPSRALKCIGDVGAPKCTLAKKSVNFGLIPIGIEKTAQLKVKNSGDDDAIYSILIPKSSPELHISPLNGRISAREFINLQIVYNPLSAHSFDVPVNISICGAAPLTFNVTGQSELPNVQIANSEFEFGRVFVGSSGSIDASISNSSAIPAILFLDLSNHPEFRIEFHQNLSDDSSSEKKNSISLVSDQTFVTKMEANSGDYISSARSSISAVSKVVPAETSSDIDTEKGLVYKMQLLENSTINFSLIFQPTEVNDHSFELPITMMNVMSSSSFHLQPIVSAEAIEAPIVMSTTALDFGIAPIFNPDNPHCSPVTHTLNLTNSSVDTVNWRFEVNGNDCFHVLPQNGSLNPNQSITAQIKFSAKSAIPYNSYLSLFVISEDKVDNLIGKVQLTGVGSSAMFKPSLREVCLPIVPLNTKSQIEISVINCGYIQSLLRIQVPVDESSFPVKITFPEGNQLLHTTAKIPLSISFQSPRPMSFTTLVAILDELGNAASFVLTCTCDNSIFTIYPFLANTNKISKSSPLSKEFLESAELQSRFLMNNDFMDMKSKKFENTFSPTMISFFQRYLNALVLSTQLSDFPGDFINSQGQLLAEAMSNLVNGKKIQLIDQNQGDSGDPIAKRRDTFKQLIQNLQSMGALISSIRPEFLMSRNDFMKLMRTKITKQLLGIDYFGSPEISSFDQSVLGEFTSSKSFSTAIIARLKVLEGVYEKLSIECWMTVLLQVFKLFVIARVDPDKMNAVAGYQDAVKQVKSILSKQQNGNELFNDINKSTKTLAVTPTSSAQELSLLKWITIHYIKVTGDYKRKFIDFSSLKDSIGFTMLLRSHSSMFHAVINENANDKSSFEVNAIEFSNALKNLKLSFMPHAEEIFDGSQCILATIAEYFYETLPHYLPSTVLDFTTTLHKTISKAISLTNPSKSEIVYRACLEGSNSFTLQQESAIVGPGQTVDFLISFAAKTIKSVSARVTLIPNRPRVVNNSGNSASTSSRSTAAPSRMPLYSAPVVVDIISSVSIVAPDATFNVETNVYSPATLTIPVKNVFGEKVTMNVLMKIVKIVDENGKNISNNKNLAQQMTSFIANPKDECEKDLLPAENDFISSIEAHNKFILSSKTISLDVEGITNFDVEFVPIDLGTYRCLILFQNESVGEFVYEVIAKSTLPTPSDIGGSKFKAEAGKRCTVALPIEIANPNLIRALAYSYQRRNKASERKFKDMLTKRTHELEVMFRQKFTTNKFNVISSAAQYYDLSNELTLYKSSMIETMSTASKTGAPNTMNITFKPTKAGEYPCKIVLLSKSDIRVYQIHGLGIPATRELSLEFSTAVGRPLKQDVPLINNSEETMQAKINISGDSSFSATSRVTVKPKSQSMIQVAFSPYKIGTFTAEMTVVNCNNESTTIYKLTANVDEPPAEDKIIVDCQARQLMTKEIEIRPFIRNGIVRVTSSVPMIQFPEEITFKDGVAPFSFSLLAPRSGVSAGTITFTEPSSKNYIWYIVEIHIDSPAPEQTIEVTTVARKPVTVSIPITNPQSFAVNFHVTINDDDITGAKEFIVPANYTSNYSVVFSPVRAMNRISSVHFYSDDGGEFWYKIKLDVAPPPEQMLAPISAPIGKTVSVFVQIDNPSPKNASFRVENDNQTAFQVIAKRVVQLTPNEKKRVEIRYIPTSVGIKEKAKISFKSTENGDYDFTITGSGKPPQPLSPTIVSAPVDTANSALILFTNPFSYPARFSISMTSDREDVFKFLVKRKVFTLNTYSEEYQIPFTFTPDAVGQYKGHIVVSSLGPARGPLPDLESMPSVRWVYPIIGNSLTLSGSNETLSLKSRAQQPISQTLSFTLVGETDAFDLSEYVITQNIPTSFEFIRSILELKPEKIERNDNTTTTLVVSAKFSPQRPFNQTISIIVKNNLGQEWQFPLELNVDLGKVCSTIVIESLLNKTGKAKILVPALFRQQAPFHAYFAAGSASEFSLSNAHGMIEQSTAEAAELPVEVIFQPKMYGKILKGLLVVDTLDAQYLFDVVGKTPDYVPPVIKGKSKIDSGNEAEIKKVEPPKKKRNIIKDNIESVKITKPKIDQK